MTLIPVSALPRKKNLQLHQSTCKPPLYIIVDSYEYSFDIGAVVYKIELGIQIGQNVMVSHLYKRYSAIAALSKEIQPILAETSGNINFPGKSIFGKYSKSFLERRMQGLQGYLCLLGRIPDLWNLEAVSRFFNISNLKIDIRDASCF